MSASDTQEDFSKAIHTEQWWNELEAQVDEAYAPFRGMDDENVTDEVRTDILIATAYHVAQLHIALRTLALGGHPKRVRGRKPKTDGNDA